MVKRTRVIIIALMMLCSFVSASNGKVISVNPKIKRLINQLHEKKTAMDAQRKLSSYGNEVTPHILPVLNEKDNTSLRVAALRVIASIADPAAEDALVAQLKDRSHKVRQEAARALSKLAVKQSSVEPLKRLLNDHYPNVRYNAIRALSKLAPKSDVDLFVGGLGDYDPRVRKFSVIALGKLKASKAVPQLTMLVRDYDPGVRMELVRALSFIGSKETLQPLVWLMGDPDINIRFIAVEAIGTLDFPEADAPLAAAADNPDPRMASIAITTLAVRNSPIALDVARAHLDDEHMVVKLAAIEVVGKFGNKTDGPVLEKLLEAESSAVRRKSKEAMSMVGSGT